MPRALKLTLLLLLGCSCAIAHFTPMLDWSGPPPAGPEGRWYKVVTADFELDTDLAPNFAMEGAEAFTRELTALRAVMGSAPANYRRPVRLVVLADQLEFEKKFSRTTGALSLNLDGQYVVFLSGRPEKWEHRASLVEGAQATITHEMAHVVMNEYFPLQTRWFAEGMAEYLASYRWSDDGTQVELGLANLEAYQIYRRFRTIGVRDMLAWGNASADSGEASEIARYGFSWAFVHYLINREPEVFGAVLESFTRGEAGLQQIADRFGPYADVYDQQVHAYMKTGEYHTVLLPVPPHHAAATISVMAPAELEQVQAMLATTSQHFQRN